MGGLARVVIAGHPHHVSQRGNGGAGTFFSDSDYALFRDLLAEHCRAADVAVWASPLAPSTVTAIPNSGRSQLSGIASFRRGRLGLC
jgi:putative transposase